MVVALQNKDHGFNSCQEIFSISRNFPFNWMFLKVPSWKCNTNICDESWFQSINMETWLQCLGQNRVKQAQLGVKSVAALLYGSTIYNDFKFDGPLIGSTGCARENGKKWRSTLKGYKIQISWNFLLKFWLDIGQCIFFKTKPVWQLLPSRILQNNAWSWCRMILRGHILTPT